MGIQFDESSRMFHLSNRFYSYILKIMENGQPGHLYFGKHVKGNGSFDYLSERAERSMSHYYRENDYSLTLEGVMHEFPAYGNGDFRHPAVTVRQQNGSTISEFEYVSYTVTSGKPKLEGLPATYCEKEDEAETLHLKLKDRVTGVSAELLYTVFRDYPALARSVRFMNEGKEPVWLEDAMSFSLDLPDQDYEWMQFSGAWGRERFLKERRLAKGIQSVESTRGNSSHYQNPFIVLRRPDTNEQTGEAFGFSLIYSGNFLIQAEVDAWDVTRLLIGINPFHFSWKLEPGKIFQTPEAVAVYSDSGLNSMSQTFHNIFRSRLVRGYWRERPRPVLINSWEAMEFNISEEKLLRLAKCASECGIEMLVLDDGWFGKRSNDHQGLGDWDAVRDCLPDGIAALADKVERLHMKFGIWIEPEMLNRDSELFRKHEDWVIRTPERRMSPCRNEFVLDLGRCEVIDYLYDVLSKLLCSAKISYIKWDMNRSITELYSAVLPGDRQGEAFHRYILGLYQLYERLTNRFPEVLFESCASGGGRFDAGLLYYSPQGWLSDDTDAMERLKIQYGTSFCYPLSSFGNHVSMSPNRQLLRKTSLSTRANVAAFGTFGYEMDLTELAPEELNEIKIQVKAMKEKRDLFQFGTFFRLMSPFEGNITAWMVVSPDRKRAIIGWYRFMNEVNAPFHRIRLMGLIPDCRYRVEGSGPQNELVLGGDELMYIGLITTDSSANGGCPPEEMQGGDFDSRLYCLTAEN